MGEFFADISSEMIYPLIPLFLVGVLGAPLVALGLIEGVAQAIVSIMSPFSGAITDKTGKRLTFVRWGYGLPILGKALISVAGSWYFIPLGRSLDRFGKGLRVSPRDALIADLIDADRRGEAFSYHRMMDTAGAFVGVLIAALVLWFLRGEKTELVYRLVFGLSAILAFCSLIVTFYVRESKAVITLQKDERETVSQKVCFSIQGLGSEYCVTLLILTVFAFANSSDTFLLLRAFDVGLSALEVVLLYALYNLGYSLFYYSAGKLSDKHGPWTVIAIGWSIYAIVCVGIALTNPFYIWGLSALYGVYMALTEGVSKALVVDSVPSAKRGTALGILYMALECIIKQPS